MSSRFFAALVGGAIFAAAGPALADPVGVYGLLQSLRYEPSSAQISTATHVRIEGWFAVAIDPGDGGGGEYNLPARGELYYACPAGMEAACRTEWAQLQALVGSTACAAWGDRGYLAGDGNGTIRPLGTATMPDVYPLGGVTSTAGGECPAIHNAATAVDLNTPPDDMGTAFDLRRQDLGLAPIDLGRTQSFSGCEVAPGDGEGGLPWLLLVAFLPLVLLLPSLRRRAG